MHSHLFWKFVAFAARTVEQRVGFVVAEEFFDHGIPAQVATESAADVAQVADRGSAVADLDIGHWQSTRLNAVESVVDLGLDVGRTIGELHVLDQIEGIAVNAASTDFDLALLANENLRLLTRCPQGCGMRWSRARWHNIWSANCRGMRSDEWCGSRNHAGA